MNCLKCRRVTETENITIPTSKRGRLLVNAQHAEKLSLNSLKE